MGLRKSLFEYPSGRFHIVILRPDCASKRALIEEQLDLTRLNLMTRLEGCQEKHIILQTRHRSHKKQRLLLLGHSLRK